MINQCSDKNVGAPLNLYIIIFCKNKQLQCHDDGALIYGAVFCVIIYTGLCALKTLKKQVGDWVYWVYYVYWADVFTSDTLNCDPYKSYDFCYVPLTTAAILYYIVVTIMYCILFQYYVVYSCVVVVVK